MAYRKDAKEKKTAKEKIEESRKELVEVIVEQMRSGTLFWRKGYHCQAMAPYNPASNCTYKGGNRMKLMFVSFMNEYKDPRWCTFKQAEEKGWKIKPGEKAVLLEKWIFSVEEKLCDENGKPILDENGKQKTKKKELEHPIANFFYVFNAEQINGIPPLEIATRVLEENEIKKMGDDLIQSSKCPVLFDETNHPCYRPKKDDIQMPLREYYYTELDFIADITHEMAHSTGHPSRMNRELLKTFGCADYAKEELRAEISSVFVQSAMGIEVDEEIMKNHSAYIQSWIGCLKDDVNEFFRAAKDAQQISDYLIANYEREREKEKNLSDKRENKEEIKESELKKETKSKNKSQKTIKKEKCNYTMRER